MREWTASRTEQTPRRPAWLCWSMRKLRVASPRNYDSSLSKEPITLLHLVTTAIGSSVVEWLRLRPAWIAEGGVAESGEAEKKVGSNFSVQSHANVHSRGSACSAGHVDIGCSSRLNTATFTTLSQRAATSSDVAARSVRPDGGPRHRTSPQRRTALKADQPLRKMENCICCQSGANILGLFSAGLAPSGEPVCTRR